MPQDPMLNQWTRPRRVNPEDIIAMLKGTPPAMPSGAAPPVVTPIMSPDRPVPLGGGQPAGPIAGDAPALGGLSPEKRRILEMIKGANASQPLTTTPPVAGASIDEREQIINPYSQGNESRPAIVGNGPGAGRIQTMIDHPTRNVNPDGSAGTVNRMSKKKAFLLGLLKGISTEGEKQGGHTWGSIIGGGGAGGAIGAINPRSIQEWQRRDDVATEQGLLNNQQKLGQQAATIAETQAQAKQRAAMPAIEAAKAVEQGKYNAARLQIQRDAIEGRKTAAQAAAEIRKLDREQRASEGDKNRKNARVIAGMRPSATDAAAAEGESLAASTSEAATTLQVEHDKNKQQLTENERAIAKKEGIWQGEAARIVAEKMIPIKDALEQVKAADPDVASGTYAETVANTERLRKAVPENEARLLGMNEDVRKGSAKASRRPAASDSYAGKRISRSKIPDVAKRLNMSVAEAEKYLTDKQAEIY